MKTCRMCGARKPLADFYRHGQMADGHLNICKPCVRARVAAHRAAHVERIRAYDRARGLLSHRKAANKARAPRYREQHAIALRRNLEELPEHHRARVAVRRAIKTGKLTPQPCERCGHAIGIHAHHEDYSKPLEVTWLCPTHHGARHREINEERRRAAA